MRARVVFPIVAGLLASRPAFAHHEALFGPQSSLAVESPGFVSVQFHTHAIGSGALYSRESVYILSAGLSPIRGVPWSIAIVQPFTTAVAEPGVATPPQSGPLTTCDGCFARENVLVNTSYRFDFKEVQRAWQKDGNFALVSVAVEPPTGNKDYPAFEGPFNGIGAAMLSMEKGAFSCVALGYYRVNLRDYQSSKKGNNALAGLGVAWTPIDDPDRMISFQWGIAAEVHERDVLLGQPVEESGGWEIFTSPTVVWSPAKGLRFFALVSLPVAQNYLDPSQTDRWRTGMGMVYSFARAEPPK